MEFKPTLLASMSQFAIPVPRCFETLLVEIVKVSFSIDFCTLSSCGSVFLRVLCSVFFSPLPKVGATCFWVFAWHDCTPDRVQLCRGRAFTAPVPQYYNRKMLLDVCQLMHWEATPIGSRGDSRCVAGCTFEGLLNGTDERPDQFAPRLRTR